MALTEEEILQAGPRDKQYKLYDGQGLFLLITPNGRKGWRFKYRFAGKEKLISLGTYPKVGLREARDKRFEARKLVAAKINPAELRKTKKQSRGTAPLDFETVAREWHKSLSVRCSATYAAATLNRLERDVFPRIGAVPINQICSTDLLEILRFVEQRGVFETVHRVKSICGQVFRHALASGLVERDPTAELKGTVPPVEKKQHAAISDPAKVGALLRAIDGYDGSFVVECSLRLAPLLFVRSGELRAAEWSEVDFYKGLWTLPAKKLQLKQPHIVPLSKQAVSILKSLYPQTGRGRFVFPSQRTKNRSLSNNALNAALRRMGYTKDEMTIHGFRTMAKTLISNRLEVRADIIEHQLAHVVRGPRGLIYSSTDFLAERVQMMQEWADYLDGLKMETGLRG